MRLHTNNSKAGSRCGKEVATKTPKTPKTPKNTQKQLLTNLDSLFC